MSSMIQFRNREDEAAWFHTDYRLRFLVELFRLWCFDRKIQTVLLTSVVTDSPLRQSPATHLEGRAADISLKPMGANGLAVAEEFGEWIDGLFVSPNRRIVVVGKYDPQGRHNDHIHIQVPKPKQTTGRITL